MTLPKMNIQSGKRYHTRIRGDKSRSLFLRIIFLFIRLGVFMTSLQREFSRFITISERNLKIYNVVTAVYYMGEKFNPNVEFDDLFNDPVEY